MNRLNRWTSLALVALTTTGSLVASGCQDAMMEEAPEQATSKVRHGHLFDRATVSSAGKGAGAVDSVRLVVGLSGTSLSAEKVVRKYGRKVVSRYEFEAVYPGVALTVPDDSLDALLAEMSTDPEIEWVEPDISVPFDADVENQFAYTGQLKPWGINIVKADNSWAKSGDELDVQGAVNVDLYVFDTGASHPDLNVVECLRILKNGPESCGNSFDHAGHGTEVAGIAAAKDNKTGIVGVAPGARVHVLKVLDPYGNAELSSVIKAVDFLTARKQADPAKPMIVNMSLGAHVGTTLYNGLDEAVRNSIAAGVVYVISAGNDGQDASLYTPAHVTEAITVGAYNKDLKLSTFSNRGSVVDLLAPGERVETLSFDGKLVYATGTSHAAPWVSGGAALLLAKSPAMTPKQVRDELVNRSSRIISAPWGTTGRSLNVERLGQNGGDGDDD